MTTDRASTKPAHKPHMCAYCAEPAVSRLSLERGARFYVCEDHE